LFDADGNLKSSTRFLPNEDDPKAKPETVYMHVYHEVPASPKTPEQEAFENAVAELLNRLVDYGAPILISELLWLRHGFGRSSRSCDRRSTEGTEALRTRWASWALEPALAL
jgi:hypothetical protein